MKNKHIIGVLGGMGPRASVEFYRLLVEEARNTYGARNSDSFPEIVLDSVPVPDFVGNTKHIEEAAILLEDRVQRLTRFGVSVITMACNTACILKERLQAQTLVPVISIVEEVTKKIVAEEKTVLLLASPTALRLGLYQLQLARYGARCVVPRSSDFHELEFIIRGRVERSVLVKKLVRLTDRYVNTNQVDAIVLGCTELPLLFPTNYPVAVHNSLAVLAESLLKRAYAKEDV